jgi:hypothetical protein
MKGQTAIEYLMTYGWAILIILIVAGVLAYYGIFAPAGFLGPTARGFGQVQVLNPWSLTAANGALTLNLENRVGGTIQVTAINYTLTNGGSGSYTSNTLLCPNGCIDTSTNLTSGSKAVFVATPTAGPSGITSGSTYTATVTIAYGYGGGAFSSTGTISGTYS